MGLAQANVGGANDPLASIDQVGVDGAEVQALRCPLRHPEQHIRLRATAVVSYEGRAVNCNSHRKDCDWTVEFARFGCEATVYALPGLPSLLEPVVKGPSKIIEEPFQRGGGFWAAQELRYDQEA